MRYYFAPLEGITGYIYRNAYQKFFHNVDCYYTPFIAPNKNQCFSSREKNDVLSEHNQGMCVVPQILTNRAEAFIGTTKALEQLGYRQVNLNLGCPSATVVTKKKGAGFLAELAQLEHFLEDIFSAVPINISVKTRIGVVQPEEFTELLDLYNQFPITELIIHPRVQKDLYNNKPNWEMFAYGVENSKNPICYNGDLFSVDDYQRFCQAFPQVDTIMLGRGILKNPGLLDEIQQQKPLDKKVLRQFHDTILRGYQEAFSGEKPVLFKMKEIWSYMLPVFADGKLYEKKIQKTGRISEYQILIEQLFQTPLRQSNFNII